MASSGMFDERLKHVVLRIRDRLRELEETDGAPWGDAGWLRKRCESTLEWSGEHQRNSMRQLVKDVRAFEAEFPGLLGADVVEAMNQADI
jgi:hypothetical protein